MLFWFTAGPVNLCHSNPPQLPDVLPWRRSGRSISVGHFFALSNVRRPPNPAMFRFFFGEQKRGTPIAFVSPRSCKNSTSKKNTLKKIWMKPSHYVFWSAMFIVIMVPIPTRSILQLTSFKSMPSSARTPGLFHLILKLVRVIVHRIEKIQMIVLLSLSNPCFQRFNSKKQVATLQSYHISMDGCTRYTN